VPAAEEIISFCDELLEIGSFEDYGPNGRQVPGSAAVSRVATGVTPTLEMLQGGLEAGAELILVHHGLIWGGLERGITPTLAQRLRALLEADATLAAYHLPLDAHPEIGNNALLCEGLGLERGEGIGEVKGRPIGFIGRSAAPVPLDAFVERLKALVGREPLIQGDGPSELRSVAIVSGGAASSIPEAAQAGVDAFLTGEPAEHAMGEATEAGIHFIAAGHFATETLGIRRLGDRVAERFGVEHEFIHAPNPV
jgi:dinuclear metal center YbgI/SA1388 family protein